MNIERHLWFIFISIYISSYLVGNFCNYCWDTKLSNTSVSFFNYIYNGCFKTIYFNEASGDFFFNINYKLIHMYIFVYIHTCVRICVYGCVCVGEEGVRVWRRELFKCHPSSTLCYYSTKALIDGVFWRECI